MKKSPLVCVFAHPDDEAFGPAGSIAKFASERDVSIICATRGDADPQFTKHDPGNLANVREKELLESAKILGVKEVRFLEFKDGSFCNNNYHELAGEIQSQLEAIDPDTVVTFDINGISGHLDHIAVALATTFVFYRLPKIHRLLYYCELEEMIGQFRKGYFIYVPRGFNSKDIDLVVNTDMYWDKRLQAMYAHVSQRSDAEVILKIISKLPKQEHFRVLEK